MKKIIYRQNKMFIIDKTQLKPNVSTAECNALYAAIYEEFRGASDNPDYSNKNNSDRFKALNEFAYNWSKSKGLI